MLMIAASSRLWAPFNVVTEKVKDHIFHLSPSKNLSSPATLEDCIYLWVNKVIQKVKYLDESLTNLTSSKNLSQYYPSVKPNIKDLCDSCVFIYLLHYYCPLHIKLDDAILKEHLTNHQNMVNICICLKFCYNYLFKNSTLNHPALMYLTPEDFLHANPDLETNFLAFFAHLFYILEIVPNPQYVKSRDYNMTSSRKINVSDAGDADDVSYQKKSSDRFQIHQMQPKVEKLLSNATKRSFNLNLHPKHLSANFNPQQSSEIYGNMNNTPRTDRKWKIDEQVLPQVSSSNELASVTSSDAARRFYERGDIRMTNLLSRVNIDDFDDEPISELADHIDEVSNITNDVSWDGFVRSTPPTVPKSDLKPRDDLRLESYRTDASDDVTNFHARPLNRTSPTSSWSDLTEVTVMQKPDGSNLILSPRQPAVSSEHRVTSTPMASVDRMSGQSGRLLDSYVVQSRDFNTVNSARAAGYPVINNTNHVTGFETSLKSRAHETPSSDSSMRRSQILSMNRDSVDHSKNLTPIKGVRLRNNNISQRRRIGKVVSCFETPSAQVQVNGNKQMEEESSKILEISRKLDLLREELADLKNSPNSVHNSSISSGGSVRTAASSRVAITTEDIDDIQKSLSALRTSLVKSEELESSESDTLQEVAPSMQLQSLPEESRNQAGCSRNLFSIPDESKEDKDSSSITFQPSTSAAASVSSAAASASSATASVSFAVSSTDDTPSGQSFFVPDDSGCASSPNVLKNREKFFNRRLIKERQIMKKTLQREVQNLEKRRKAKEEAEKAILKKKEEKERRERLLKQHIQEKQDNENVSLAYRQSGVVTTSEVTRPKKKSKSTNNLTDAYRSNRMLTASTSSHLDLSKQRIGQSTPYGINDRDLHSDNDSVVSSVPSEYTGPRLFKELKAKTNKNLIRNAITFSCLPGKVNENNRQKILPFLDSMDGGHYMILFRDNKQQFRGVYYFDVQVETLSKVAGVGPFTVVPNMVLHLYKYNSGKRTFTKIPSKTLSYGVEAFTLKNQIWNQKK